MSSVSQQLEGAPRTSSLDTQPPTNPIEEYHVINPHTLPAKIREITDKNIQGVAMFFYVIANILTVGLLFGIDYGVNKVQADVVKKLETELRKMIHDDVDENEDQGVTSSNEKQDEIRKLGEKLLDAKLALTKVNSPISDKDALEIILKKCKEDYNITSEMDKISSGEKKDDTDVYVAIGMQDKISEIIEARLKDLEISSLSRYIDIIKDGLKNYLEKVIKKNRANPDRAIVSKETTELAMFTDEIVKNSLEVVELEWKGTHMSSMNKIDALEIIKAQYTGELVSIRRKVFDEAFHVKSPKTEANFKSLNMIIDDITSRIAALQKQSPSCETGAEAV